MYKLKPSRGGCDDLSIGFDRDNIRKQRELINKKNLTGKYHVRIMLRDVFGFAEHQEKATYGLHHELTLTGKKYDAVLNKAETITDAGMKFDKIHSYVPH